MEKLMITAAITGGASPQGNPYLPKNPREQIQAAVDAWNAGASIIHIHGRNPETGMPDHEAEYIAEAIAGIRERCDVLINVTTGGSGHRVDLDWLYREIPKESVRGRFQVIADLSKDPVTRPDLASFNAGSPVIDIYSKKEDEFLLKFVMVHSFDDMRYGARILREWGVKAEIECYDVGMVNNGAMLREIGDIGGPLYFDFVMGVLGQIPATVENVIAMRRTMPEGSIWSACGIGLSEWPMITTAILLGGHVRVGFEDNIYLSRGVAAKSNAELVEKAVRLAGDLGRDVATVNDARRLLGLEKGA